MSVNIRMTAIRLEEGGLWIHAPVAPTEECVRLLTELGEEVRYIVLPTTAVRASKRMSMSIVGACASYGPRSRSFADSFRREEHSCHLERCGRQDAPPEASLVSWVGCYKMDMFDRPCLDGSTSLSCRPPCNGLVFGVGNPGHESQTRRLVVWFIRVQHRVEAADR